MTQFGGTTGKKEGIIVSPSANNLVPSSDGLTRCIVEAKFQNSDGSVDEKIPFLWLSFLESKVPNWVIVFDGSYWMKRPKANKVLDWLRNKSLGAPTNRRLIVVQGVKEFYPFVKKTWEA